MSLHRLLSTPAAPGKLFDKDRGIAFNFEKLPVPGHQFLSPWATMDLIIYGSNVLTLGFWARDFRRRLDQFEAGL